MAVGIGVLFPRPREQHLHFGVCVIERDAASNLADDAEPRWRRTRSGGRSKRVAGKIVCNDGWSVSADVADFVPGIEALRDQIFECGRQDSDDSEDVAFELNALAQNGGIATEGPLEGGPREHNSVAFRWSEQAPERGMRVQHGPEIPLNCADSFSSGFAAVKERHIFVAYQRHCFERLRLLFPQNEIGAAHEAVVPGMMAVGAAIVGNPDEAIRFGIGQRLEYDSIDHAEHRRVHSDAEGQRQHCCCGESGASAQRAEGVS